MYRTEIHLFSFFDEVVSEIQTFLNNILATSSACLILCLFWFCCDAHFFFRPEKGPDDLCVSIR
ncbi:hypothetical protein OUZ56_031925 [Daphnia magna]|uniref:Uncharacterized protein n=1 Tax=Daphnia magna TaxID=35525 RepID=A0ABQ9ZVM3_9CRUS|nr:hypothetical protein OUZ56_031925 [Daphnia magna]